MPWFQVDDRLNGHPKARRAGLAAIGLWTVAGSWSMQQLTEGFVPAWLVETWPSGRRLAAALVAAGLWKPETANGEKGWRFHQWEEFQKSKDQVMADRAAAAERQRRARGRVAGNGGKKGWTGPSNAVSHAVTNGVTHGSTGGVTDGVSHAPPVRAGATPAHGPAHASTHAKHAEPDFRDDGALTSEDPECHAVTDAVSHGPPCPALPEGQAVAGIDPPVSEADARDSNGQGDRFPESADPLTRLVADVCAIRPRWTQRAVEDAAVTASQQRRKTIPEVRTALVAVAERSDSTAPGRVLHDGPWWSEQTVPMPPPARERLAGRPEIDPDRNLARSAAIREALAASKPEQPSETQEAS